MSTLDRCFDLADMREAARRHLPKAVFEFVDRGAERELALDENIAAFARLTRADDWSMAKRLRSSLASFILPRVAEGETKA